MSRSFTTGSQCDKEGLKNYSHKHLLSSSMSQALSQVLCVGKAEDTASLSKAHYPEFFCNFVHVPLLRNSMLVTLFMEQK